MKSPFKPYPMQESFAEYDQRVSRFRKAVKAAVIVIIITITIAIAIIEVYFSTSELREIVNNSAASKLV